MNVLWMKRSRCGGGARLASAVLVALAIFATGCTSAGSDAPKSESKVVPTGTDAQIANLTWGVASGPRSLDFNHAFDSVSWIVWGELAEPLVTVDSTGEVIPALASSWSATPEKVVFTLQPDVTFTDGKPVTAADVVWSLDRISDPKVASEFASFWGNVSSVEATASDEVTVTLKEPDSTFLFSMRVPRIYQKAAGLQAGDGFGTTPGSVVGTGPYEADSFSPATGATMTRYDGYWGTKPTAKQIDVKVVSDPDTLRLAVQSGEVDGTFDVPLASAPAWDKMDTATTIYGPSTGMNALLLDTTKPPFNDVHARRAVAYSVDRAGLVKALYNGHGTPQQILAPELLWANYASDEQVEEFVSGLPDLGLDLGKAKAELARSATPDGFSFVAYAPTEFPQYAKMLQVLKQSLSELNITVSIKQVPLASYVGRITGKDKDPLSVTTYGAVSADPLGGLRTVLSSGQTTYAPPEMTELLSEYQRAPKDRQLDIAKTVLTQLSEDMPIVPISTDDVALALNNKYVYTREFTSWYGTGEEWAHSIRVAE